MKIPYNLKQEFTGGNLVLFVGAGFVKNYVKNLPTWEDLLKQIFGKINNNPNEIFRFAEDILGNSKYDRIPPQLYLKLAQMFESNRQRINEAKKINGEQLLKSIYEYVSEIIESNYKTIDKMTVLLENTELNRIRELPLNNWITTNYDCFIEDILYNKQDDKCILKRPIDMQQFKDYGLSRKILKIHGCIEHEHPEKSIVITEDDYYRFLKEDRYLVNKLFTIFCEKTVVFLGYSLEDPNINMIYNDVLYDMKRPIVEHVMYLTSQIRPAYFVSYKKIPVEQKAYFQNKKIEYIEKLSISDFFKELIEIYDEFKIEKEGIIEKITAKQDIYQEWYNKLSVMKYNTKQSIPISEMDILFDLFNLYFIINHEPEIIYKIGITNFSQNGITTALNNIREIFKYSCEERLEKNDLDILEKLFEYFDKFNDKKDFQAKYFMEMIENILIEHVDKPVVTEAFIHKYFKIFFYLDEISCNWNEYEYLMERFIVASCLCNKSSVKMKNEFIQHLFNQLKLAGRNFGESWYSLEKIYSNWNKFDKSLWDLLKNKIESELVRYNPSTGEKLWTGHSREMLESLAPGKDYKSYLPRT